MCPDLQKNQKNGIMRTHPYKLHTEHYKVFFLIL